MKIFKASINTKGEFAVKLVQCKRCKRYISEFSVCTCNFENDYELGKIYGAYEGRAYHGSLEFQQGSADGMRESGRTFWEFSSKDSPFCCPECKFLVGHAPWCSHA